MKFHLTAKARAELIEIAKYTQENWGVKQRNTYLEQLDKTFHTIAQNPKKGRNCDYIRAGYRKILVGRHIIFYRQFNAKEIQIVSILHDAMDVESHLRIH
jgi:toxin ParE1/3/4